MHHAPHLPPCRRGDCCAARRTPSRSASSVAGSCGGTCQKRHALEHPLLHPGIAAFKYSASAQCFIPVPASAASTSLFRSRAPAPASCPPSPARHAACSSRACCLPCPRYRSRGPAAAPSSCGCDAPDARRLLRDAQVRCFMLETPFARAADHSVPVSACRKRMRSGSAIGGRPASALGVPGSGIIGKPLDCPKPLPGLWHFRPPLDL